MRSCNGQALSPRCLPCGWSPRTCMPPRVVSDSHLALWSCRRSWHHSCRNSARAFFRLRLQRLPRKIRSSGSSHCPSLSILSQHNISTRQCQRRKPIHCNTSNQDKCRSNHKCRPLLSRSPLATSPQRRLLLVPRLQSIALLCQSNVMLVTLLLSCH